MQNFHNSIATIESRSDELIEAGQSPDELEKTCDTLKCAIKHVQATIYQDTILEKIADAHYISNENRLKLVIRQPALENAAGKYYAHFEQYHSRSKSQFATAQIKGWGDTMLLAIVDLLEKFNATY